MSWSNQNLSIKLIPFRCLLICININSKVSCIGNTGVEMEALMAVSVSALTIYDMCKAVDRGMEIGAIRLTHKSGGKSGVFDGE